MKRPAPASWLALLLASGAAGGAGARLLQQPLDQVLPGPPNAGQAKATVAARELAASWVAYEAGASASEAEVAGAQELATRAQLEAAQHELQVATVARTVKQAAGKAQELRRRAEAAAQETARLVDAVPKAIERGADRAVKEVAAAAVGRMNAVVRETVEAAKAADAAAKQAAASEAQEAALPFLEERLKAEETMYKYSDEAQALASAAGQLKRRSVELARESQAVHRLGNASSAQELQASAQALMTKALELESQAKGKQRRAEEQQGGLGIYALKAQAAAARAALKANPGGDEPLHMPAPPPPLTMPPLAAAPP